MKKFSRLLRAYGISTRMTDLDNAHLRAAEVGTFHRQMRRVNARRTRLVGYVLLACAAILALVVYFEVLDENVWAYLRFVPTLAVGVLVINWALPRDATRISLVGEVLILGTAIVWMFTAVAAQFNGGFGLAEFVIGTLGVALLRYLTPRNASVVFASLAAGYGLLMWNAGVFEFGPWFNGVVFCVFAYLWSIGSVRSRKIDFKNSQLLLELNRQNYQLSSLALQDPLTRLPNRRFFDELLAQRWSDSDRPDECVQLMLIDIDRFKEYNDRLGHPAGDACLQQTARTISTTVGSTGVCMRLGGEEFAVLLDERIKSDASAIAHRVLHGVRASGEITVSIGLAGLRPSAGSPQELYELADRELYRAKEAGRDRVSSA